MRRILLAAALFAALGCSGNAADAGEGKGVMVLISTSMGDIKVELNKEKAPISVKNFLSYVKKGHYDGTIFHRVIPNFMIQGGGFDAKMSQKPTDAPIKNEATNGLKNDEGTIAMARTNIVDSATAQFFINVRGNEFLNHTGTNPRQYGYAVFGKVTDGLDVVHKIEHVKTGTRGGHGDVPVEPVVINSVKVVDQ